jgi:hypothetical protein
MSKSYKIKVNQGGGEAKFVDIPQVSGGGQPLAVKAVPGGKYQLVDTSTGYGPENIRATRSGQNLKVYFEGRGQPDLVIEDYYKETPEGFNGLIGEAESGRFYEYIPETAAGNSSVPLLADGSNQVGMALGGAEINASGAAVGALVAAAGLNPLLLAPLALLGAGGGGGGGGGTDPSNNNAAGIKITKVTTDTGVSNSDFVTQGPVTEFSGTLSSFTGTPGDKVKLELLNKDGTPLNPVITGMVTPIQTNGVWSWKWSPVDTDANTNLPEVLKEGDYVLKATIVTAAGVAYTHATASTTQAVDIDTTPNEGDNKDATVSITTVSDDTGTLNTDWLTSDTSLIFNGTLSKFSATLGDVVKLELDPVKEGEATIVQYATPVLKDGVWGWLWDAQTTPFAQGAYKLTATLVDKAGNAFTQTGASASKDLTIDTSGPTDSKGLAIVSMSVDSGVGSFSPLDPSRADFKTNDNTPVFTGKLDIALPQGESIVVQLMKGNDVVETGSATVDATGLAWTWTPKAPLADATYQLKAQVVDFAGNPAVTAGTTAVIPPASQEVVIDTKGSTDETDLNKGLKTTSIGLSTDTAGEEKTNNDFVTSDGGNKDKVNGNDDDKLTFTGTLNSAFTKNGGKVWVQIIDANGVVKSSAYMEPEAANSNSWKYENLVSLTEGQYVAKSILLDHVGNMISATDQSFYIDITAAGWTPVGATNTGSPINRVDYKDFSFSMGESGTYKFGSIGDLKTYNGGTLIFDTAGKTFEAGKFVLDFWDQAGNLTQITNKDQTWVFGAAAQPVTPISTDANFLASKNFTGAKTVGSVGTLQVSSNFDMASLYDGLDTIVDQAAANHIVLSNTSDVTLTLSMGDVLALGVTNSFSVSDVVNAKHKGQIQMRIDGQTGDKLNLDGLVNGLDLDWVGGNASTNLPLDIGSEKYDVYTNAALGIALFVDQQIEVKVF